MPRAQRGTARTAPVRIFFITNRECAPRAGDEAPCPQQDDTAANLESLGLGSATLADDLMLNGERPEWDSEKLARRQAVARTHRIVLNVGDDFADFLPGVRRATVDGTGPRALRAPGCVGPALVPRAEPDVRFLARCARARHGCGARRRTRRASRAARRPEGCPSVTAVKDCRESGCGDAAVIYVDWP